MSITKVKAVLWLVVGMMCLLTPVSRMLAQDYRGTISGIVTDAQGATVPHATVTVTEINKGSSTTTETTSNGRYTIPLLLPGTYQIKGEAATFETYLRKGVTLDPGGSVEVDMKLEVGSANVTVTVTGDVPLVQYASAQVGQIFTTQQVDDVPLNGNSPYALAQLAVGVITTGTPGFNPPFNNSGLTSFVLAGSPPQTTEVSLDGVTNTDYLFRLAYSPPTSVTAQAQIYLFQPDAAYGHTGGGFINVLTKSGTNTLHGTAYEYNQNTYFRANNYFNDRNHVAKPPFRYNQYGLEMDGPIFIPKVWDGRDKAFWVIAWEGIRDTNPTSTYTTVPTAAERKGDFSALLPLNTANTNYQLYDPASATSTNGGTTFTRQPFSNNIIPTNRLDPIAQNYMKFYPLPNVAVVGNGLNDYFASIGNPDIYDLQFARFDTHFSRDNFFLDFRHSNRRNVGNDLFGNGSTATYLKRIIWGSTIDNTYTLTPTTLVDVRFNWTRFTERVSAPLDGLDLTSLGFPAYMQSASPYRQLPAIQPSGTCTSGTTSGTNFQCMGNTNLYYIPYDTFQLFGQVTKIFKGHSVKVGFDGRDYIRSVAKFGSEAGTFGFNQAWVNSGNGSAAAPFGMELASFLLGLPTSGAFNITAKSTLHNKYLGLFVQDDWRVSSTLTLNLGLRFDHEMPLYERHNRSTNGFDFTDPNPISAAAIAAYNAHPISQIPVGKFATPGGLTFATSAKPQIYVVDSYIFSPRIGFAWAPKVYDGKTVIRGGYGMFTAPIPLTQVLNQQGLSQTTSFIQTTNNYYTVANTLDNPFPGGIQQPVGSAAGLATFNGQSITFFNPKTKDPYGQRWNLDLQQQLGKKTVVEFAYIGAHYLHLDVSDTNLNFIPRQYLSTSTIRDTAMNNVINMLNATVPNPMSGLIPGTNLNVATIATSQLLLPYPQYPLGGVDQQNTPIGSAFFESLNIRVERRMTKNVSLIASYEWSKQMEAVSRLNDSDLKLEHRLSSYDRPQRFVLAATYRIPVGRGQALNLSSKWADLLAGGWTLNSVFTAQSGPPLVWSNVIYNGGPLHYYHARDTVKPTFDVTQFNTNSSQQLVDNIRTFKSTYGNLRQDGINDLDASVLKNFQISRTFTFQLRFEAFNVLNHPTFSPPNLTPTSGSTQTGFGHISAQYNQPRVVQIAGRLRW